MTDWAILDQATLLALLRGLHLASVLSMLGVLGFIAWILPAASADGRIMVAPLVRFARISGCLALLTGLAWFILQSTLIAGADTLPDIADAVPIVAMNTRYGQTVMLRLCLLVVATGLAGRSLTRLYPTLLLVAVALGLQGIIGHAGAIGGPIGDGITASEALHLIAAGLWLGGLLPLWLTVGRLSSGAAARVCERFTPIGLACVLVIAGTGLAQGVELIGSLPALVGTPYGHIACLKIGLFVLALVLAALNRLWLTDRLSDAIPGSRTRLRLSLILESLAGLAIILAAGFLASHSPGVHDEPVWPFPWRFSLVTLHEEPDFLREVVLSALLIGLGIVAFIAACVWRRLRLPALVLLAGVLAYRAPSFALLTVEAYPTSFQTSPTDFSADSIVRGQALYAQNCVSCHGANGQGDGPAAAGLRIKPADLTMPHLWDHSDGELFWWLTHGIDDPEGGLAMPGFGQLSAADRWALIDYIRAHNAGLAMRQDGAFDMPIQAPALPVQCAGDDASRSADLRGRVVYVMAGGAGGDQTPLPPQSAIPAVTLVLSPDQTEAPPARGTCVAATFAAWPAYAILADVPADKLAGSVFLVDANGWLRAVHTPGTPGGWHSGAALMAAVRAISASPLHPFTGGEHAHHH